MSTLSTANIESKAANTPPVIKDLNGTECGQFCRAWVNFNGTGTVAIRDSFNVSSITDNATGNYTVNFTTAMPNINYSVVSSSDRSGNSSACAVAEPTSTTAFTLRTVNVSNNTLYDANYVGAAVFGG